MLSSITEAEAYVGWLCWVVMHPRKCHQLRYVCILYYNFRNKELTSSSKSALKSDQKIKSKGIVIIFGESMNYKSGVSFCVPSLEVQFWPLNMALFAEIARVWTSKKTLPVPAQKNPRPLL